jgi:hypothetical protein
VEKASHFGPGWIELGDALLKPGGEEKARETLETRTGGGINSVDAMRGLTDIYSKRRGVPHTATEEQRQKEIEQAREPLLQERRLWDG